MKRFFLILILFVGAVNYAHADAEGQIWGRKAGDYFSAVILASEFKKTICGQYLNVPDAWTDANYARQNILKKLPTKYHKEFNAAFNPNEEIRMRHEMKSMVAINDKSKCNEMAKGLKELIAPRINNW